jgi:hypothetical protein
MGIETSTTIQGLNGTWPLGTDPRSEGDNHLRLTKTVLKNVFDDSNGNALLFKVIGIRFSKSTGYQSLEGMAGAVVRGQINFSVGVPTNVTIAAMNAAGTAVNRLTVDETGVSSSAGEFFTYNGYTVRETSSLERRARFSGDIAGAASRAVVEGYTSTEVLDQKTYFLVGGIDHYGDGGTAQFVFRQMDAKPRGAVQVLRTAGAGKMSLVAYEDTGLQDGRVDIEQGRMFLHSASYEGGPAAGTTRFEVNGNTASGQAAIVWLSCYDDAGVEQNRIEVSPLLLNMRARVAVTSGNFRLSDGNNQRRAELAWSAGSSFSVQSWNSAGVLQAQLLHDQATGEYRCYYGGAVREIVQTGHLEALVYTGSTAANLTFPIGTTVIAYSSAAVVNNFAQAVYLQTGNQGYALNNTGLGQLVGTWRCRGTLQMSAGNFMNMFQRTG